MKTTKNKTLHMVVSLAALLLTVSGAITASAATSDDTTLSQTINAGALATEIRDENRATVASPSVAMSAITFSFTCQSGGGASTGTLGTNTQRLYVDNPDAADNGWTLAIAATSGATTLWQNTGSTQNFDFNDAGGAGCTDGADADTRPGQLTVNPTAGTLTADCGSCTTANITKGSSTAYVQATTDSITLLTAASTSDDIGRWYFTGVGLSQTIPAEQAATTYTLGQTITVTAS